MKLKDILHKFDIPTAKVVAQESTAAVVETHEVQTNAGLEDAVRMLRLAGLHARADKLVAEAGIVSGTGVPVTSGSGAQVQSGTGPTADAAAAAKAKLSPEQLKWLGGADPTDPIIMARLKKAVPDAPAGGSAAQPAPGTGPATGADMDIATQGAGGPTPATPGPVAQAVAASGQPDDATGVDAAVAANAAKPAGAAAQPAAAPKPAAKPDPAVLKQQQDLIAKGAKIKADGIMGPATQAAIKQFSGGSAPQPAAGATPAPAAGTKPAPATGGAFAGSDPAKIDAEIKRFSGSNDMSLQSNKDYVASLEKKKAGGAAQPAAPANPVTGAANAAAAAKPMGGRGSQAPAAGGAAPQPAASADGKTYKVNGQVVDKATYDKQQAGLKALGGAQGLANQMSASMQEAKELEAMLRIAGLR